MTIQIKNITVKNFMSVGNVSQAISFNKEYLTLILGSNLDLGGEDTGNRNGTGKSTILNALSYALYGQALTKIKKENLINKINGKHMIVTVEFEKNTIKYKIERGRKPNVLKLFVNDQLVTSDESDGDESQGDSRDTQNSINQILEMSHVMFKHLIALNTYTEPFLAMRAADQREVIEQLLGITILSEKAEALKIQIKDTKDNIQKETFKIEGIKSANENVLKSISSLEIKSNAWDSKKDKDVENLAKSIMNLQNVDIEQEIKLHNELNQWTKKDSKLKELTKQKATLESAVFQAQKTFSKYEKEFNKLKDHKCPTCEQDLHDEKHLEMEKVAKKNLSDSEDYYKKISADLEKISEEIKLLGEITKKPITFYDSDSEALSHKNNVDNLEKTLMTRIEEVNPYQDQIEELKNTAIQKISWDAVNSLTTLKDHQEFLLKLLTSKDSFVRKKIIDQNLSYLNKRLDYYIDKLGLPHKVIFQNDLNVEITQYGQDLDFDNLSRGERNRLILSMSFAFRDVWENLYHSTNLLFIDELIDSGMDTAGVESAIQILKKMSRERNKNIYLISHKEELIGRVNSVLKVVKEGGFTSYSNTVEYVE
jgi:DNA repair exonuclease SbcCD ATPase subunit